MNEQPYRVETLSPAETDAFFRSRLSGPENRSATRSMRVAGFEIKGEFFLTARNTESNEVEWEHSEKNLITDFGRRQWMENRWWSAELAFAPSIEAPQTGRYSISTTGTQVVDSGGLTPGNTPATHTKAFSFVFTAPGTNRSLGTIALGRTSTSSATHGIEQLISFALLTPPKTQTTVQTLEVVYRVSMNPIA